MKPVVNLYKLGRLPYLEALKFQLVLFDKLKKNILESKNGAKNRQLLGYDQSGIGSQIFDSQLHSTENLTTQTQFSIRSPSFARNSLILVEHEPVFTIGIRSKQYNDNYVSDLKRRLAKLKLKADFVQTNRGGLITFHGPGQLVAYPIIYLGDFQKTISNRSVKAFVNNLQTTIIDTLAKVGLKGAHTVKEYPGVWLDNGEKKIAFIGIACQQHVTMHGLAINCNCDLSWYDHVVSCGIEDKSITSVHQELLSVGKSKSDLSSLDNTYSNNFQIHGFSSKSNMVDRHRLDGSNVEFLLEGNVEHVSEMFCQSFSDHFDCKLLENSLDSSITN